VLKPQALLTDCGIQHPIGKGADQIGFLRQRDELVWRQQTIIWVLPAHQCLQPHKLQSASVELGLIMQHQLALLDRPIQLVAKHDVLPHRWLAFGVVEGKHAPIPLGRVHRGVGPLQQLAGFTAILWMKGDADACR
jgi:hypothetical protein